MSIGGDESRNSDVAVAAVAAKRDALAAVFRFEQIVVDLHEAARTLVGVHEQRAVAVDAHFERLQQRLQFVVAAAGARRLV